MYEAYYGFREKPFALSPDPRYLFLSGTHREVLGHLLYGIEQGEGFMAISGEVGTGKTTLCRTLLDRLGSSCEIAFLFNPTLTPTDLVKAINGEFGLSTFGDSRPELLDVLNTFLLEQNALGRRVLVIIDEAQNLPRDTLEQLRLLSNLESRTQKLLQIILIGQPELDDTLETTELRQLRQRITVWWRLGPLTGDETREYVRHRLRVAAGGDRDLFTDAALSLVHRLSRGVPRLVNVLCDRSLLAGYGDQSPRITPGIVRTAAHEVRLAPATRPWTWVLGGVAAMAAAIAALGWMMVGAPGTDRALPPPTPPVAAAAPAGSAEPVPDLAPPDARAAFSPDPADEIAALAPDPADAIGALPDPADAIGALPDPVLGDEPLDNLLSLVEARATNGQALAALLDAWRIPSAEPGTPSFPQLLATLEERGLAVLRSESLEQIESLGLPALVQVRGPDGEQRVVLIRHLSGPEVLLEGVIPGQVLRVSREMIQQRWSGAGYVAWRNYEGLPPLLRAGQSGGAVSFVQRSLARLGYYVGDVHGSFDDATERAVVAFQRGTGLRPDGAVGPLTQVRLYHSLPDYRMPLLVLGGDAQASAL